MAEQKFNAGDHIIYKSPHTDDKYDGDKGIVEGIAQDFYGVPHYEIDWSTGLQKHTTEPENYLQFDPDFPTPAFTRLTKETAEKLVMYLSLDAVEDEIVASWVKELQDYASR